MNIMNAPKTSTFQMRINPEIKSQAEQIFQNCGMTLTDAINVFIQQAMNVGGMPFIVTQNSREALKDQAIARLMAEIQKGRNSVRSESDWVSEEECSLISELGLTLNETALYSGSDAGLTGNPGLYLRCAAEPGCGAERSGEYRCVLRQT